MDRRMLQLQLLQDRRRRRRKRTMEGMDQTMKMKSSRILMKMTMEGNRLEGSLEGREERGRGGRLEGTIEIESRREEGEGRRRMAIG